MRRKVKIESLLKRAIFLILTFTISTIVSSSNISAEELSPSWRVNVGNKVVVVSSANVADIDKSFPGLEVAVGTWDYSGATPKGKMYVIHQDGSIASGWPVEIPAQIGSSPAVGDLDNDGDLEIVVGSRGSVAAGVFAWHHDGKPLASWPYIVGWVATSPTLVDLDNDKDLEIIFASTHGTVSVLHHDDKDNDGNADNFIGWPVHLHSYWLDSSPAVADIDMDGSLEIVIADWDKMVYVLRKDGTIAPGWPKQATGVFYSSSAIGDLDPGYPGLEIIIASLYEDDSNGARIYAWHADGTFVSGWPVQVEYISGASNWVLSSPSLGDINGDGNLEVIVGCQDGRIYAYKADGQRLWYYDAGREIDSSAALGDVDGDGDIEIVVGSWSLLGDTKVAEKGRLYILNHDGTVHNWVVQDDGGEGIYSSPALGDIDRDGKLEVVFGSQGVGTTFPGAIFCYKLGPVNTNSTLPWPTFRHDFMHTGNYHSTFLTTSTTQVNLKIIKDPQASFTTTDAFTITNTGFTYTDWELYNNQDGTYTPPGGTPMPMLEGFGFNLTIAGIGPGETIIIAAYVNNNLQSGLYQGSYKLKELKRYLTLDVATIYYCFDVQEPLPPQAPSNLSAIVYSPTSIKLTWKDNSTNETGFKIERSNYTGGPFTQIATVSTNATSYTDSGLTPNETYGYRVCAYNEGGNSLYSNTVYITFSKPLVAPTSLAAKVYSSTAIKLTWKDNSNNERGFKIERATSSSGPFSPLASVAANATSYINSGLTTGTTYYYRIYAYNPIGNSAYSNTAYTKLAVPSAPTNLTATAVSSSQINLTWQDNSTNETGFKIERATASAGPFSQIATVGANIKTFSNTGLAVSPTHYYYYRVRAYNGAGNSAYSNTASAATQPVSQ